MSEQVTWTAPQIRMFKNRHGSATALLESWQRGSLMCPNPIWLGPDRVQVEGVHTRSWQPVSMDVRGDFVTVVRHRKQSFSGV